MNFTAPQKLPSPPPKCSGWPWTSDSHFGSGDIWPRITVITPSFNQGRFIEETIRSVLLQNYPNLEYIIMDGGSTDQTVQIIKKYETWLAGWVSEKDHGQPHAINKGWKRATGEIVAWINSDDWYLPGALEIVARLFMRDPSCFWVSGGVDNCFSPGKLLKRYVPRSTPLPQLLGLKNSGLHQPGMFWRKKMADEVGVMDETMHFGFDHDFFARSLLKKFEPVCVPTPLAGFRVHRGSKTTSHKHMFAKEYWQVFERYKDKLSRDEQTKVRNWLAEYEADLLLTSTYAFLARGERWQALRYLISRSHLFSRLKPRKAGLGALYRTVVTGHPPEWFRG